MTYLYTSSFSNKLATKSFQHLLKRNLIQYNFANKKKKTTKSSRDIAVNQPATMDWKVPSIETIFSSLQIANFRVERDREMYVTRPLSMYRENPGELLVPPPLAPNSGYLVIKDEFPGPDDDTDTCCWDICPTVKKLPFPQNMILSLPRPDETRPHKFLFIPVLDQPLFSNRYYVIIAHGRYIGQAYQCSTEEDMQNLCFNSIVQDIKPKPFDHRNVYHQVEISKDNYGRFYAKSIAPDGFPPGPLRIKGWEASYASFCTELIEAQGLNSSLRERLPDFNFPLSNKRSDPVTVGQWCCPFIFVREEGSTLRSQMKKSMFYEITLEQYWEEICTRSNSNDGGEGNSVSVDANVQREASFIAGEEAVKDGDGNGDDGIIWFKSWNEEGSGRKRVSIGLSSATMKWVQKEGGWVDRGERNERIERVVENENESGGWRRLGCYVLVESFVFKREDKSLVLNCDFKHTHQTKSKWE